MEREISIQINLNHESIIGLFGSFEDENNIYLVQVPIDPHSHTACTAHTALLSMVHWDPTSCPPSYRPDNSPPGMENPTHCRPTLPVPSLSPPTGAGCRGRPLPEGQRWDAIQRAADRLHGHQAVFDRPQVPAQSSGCGMHHYYCGVLRYQYHRMPAL